jgi:TRAP-type C4-dicarboxylate transport system substrate-binding protein
MKRRSILAGASIALAGALAVSLPAAAQEVTLRALATWPTQMSYVQSFLKYVAKVNAAGKGVIQINHIGGPEVTPQPQQGLALKNGVFDLHYGPGGIYQNLVPEGDAIFGGNVSPMQARANGGLALLDEIWQKKLNAKLLAQFDAGARFHLFFREAPKRAADGSIDLKGLRIRSSPAWREFIISLGGNPVIMTPSDTYGALERGVVEGTGWTIQGLMDIGWDKFLKYQLNPGFMTTDIVVVVNLDKWKTLSAKAQQILTDVAIQHEKESYDATLELTKREQAELQKRGIQIVTLDGKASKDFLAAAYKVPWDRLKSRDAAYFDRLREKFYIEQ